MMIVEIFVLLSDCGYTCESSHHCSMTTKENNAELCMHDNVFLIICKYRMYVFST